MFPQIFGKYVLQREIAAGGMARVFEATLRGAGGFEKRLVVKQIRPELASDSAFVDRFVEEAKTTVELSHSNIVPVYELGVEQGIYFIAMEYCEGATLSDVLRETGPLEPAEGAYVGVEICRALDYAHRRVSVVHRDVTPRNVLIDDEGAVRLIDFGIAAPAGASRETHHDGEGDIPADVLGSPGHMPPEQIAGKKLTPETDVFAVATLLIEAWTGRPPFRRQTVAECETALRETPPRLSEHDERLAPLDDLIASGVRLARSERPEDAEALARPLRDFMRDVDSGDVERRLGERARLARGRTSSNSAWPTGDRASEALLDDVEASAAVGVTRTFAARDGEQWTRPIAAANSESGRDDAADAGVETTGEAAPELSTRKLPSLPPVTGADHQSAAEASSSPKRRVAAAAAVVVVGGAVAALALSDGATGGSIAKSADPSPATAAPASVPTPASAAPAPSASASASASTPAKVPPRPSTAVAAGAGHAAPERDGGKKPEATKATLSLTSDPPGVSVTVGGRTYATPVSGIALWPGTYGVTFTFAATGENKPASVRLVSGQKRGVHADFTGATPRIYVR